MSLETEEWIEDMVTLIENEELRRFIGEKSYNKVKKDYNAKTIAKEYSSNIKDMIKGKRRISKEMAVLAMSGQ
jgi:glycosyltransferase involved in cell wall biosynthesis